MVVAVLVLRDGSSEPGPVTVPPLGGADIVVDGDAPDFSVELFDGSTFRLASHLSDDGRPVVLNLWASWCAPCRAEMPAFDAVARANPDVYIIGVAVEDTEEAARDFALEIGVTYPLGADEADRVARRYPSPGLPATYLIDTEGSIARTIFGGVSEETLETLLTETFG